MTPHPAGSQPSGPAPPENDCSPPLQVLSEAGSLLGSGIHGIGHSRKRSALTSGGCLPRRLRGLVTRALMASSTPDHSCSQIPVVGLDPWSPPPVGVLGQLHQLNIFEYLTASPDGTHSCPFAPTSRPLLYLTILFSQMPEGIVLICVPLSPVEAWDRDPKNLFFSPGLS